jgi:phenylalanyl-tRNA synthetase beta chain
MKIFYKDLSSRIVGKPSIEDISKRLFQLGHEHEVHDGIFDIEFTPNRGDCLSVNGLLRDLSVFFDLNEDKQLYQEQLNKLEIDFENKFVTGCKKISFLKVDIEEELSQYSGELKDYFENLELNKNNFFTDISNYVAYETGQPTHCYDFNKIGKKIIFEEIDTKYDFNTLLGKKISLNGRNSVFKSNENIINLAGIVGDMSSSCSDKTRSVLIECAYFDPEIISGKAVRYDISSEAAYKFERGVDHNCHENVLRRFLHIIEKHSTIKNIQFFTKKYDELPIKSIKIDVNKINSILGTKLTYDFCIEKLTNLGFYLDGSELCIPSYRNDISNSNDLAEEIARIIGYDNIKPKRFKIDSIKSGNIDEIDSKIKSLLIDNGFYEVINNPFVNNNEGNDLIKIDNPLDVNRNYLRGRLKESLLNNLLYNERRQKDSIKLFEISDIYSFDKITEDFHFKRKIGIIASGRVDKNYKDFSRKIDEKYFAGVLQKISKDINFKFELISRESLDTKIKNKIVYLELNIDEIPKSILDYSSAITKSRPNIIYEPISEFPSSTKDISFSVLNFSNLKELEYKVLNYEHINLKESFVFDFYKNNDKKEIKIGFRFIFQSSMKTMTDNDVNKILDDIIKTALSVSDVAVPGLDY